MGIQMGKAKQNMELIRNDKTQYVTFQKRKKGLKKKTYELKTLCDVEVCLIIYGLRPMSVLRMIKQKCGPQIPT
ncbi:Developmental protein SEPALLATA 3 [Camellia lanceoleosa]|uniref:Developmental protein SEPALLATA 3 n=1 Tax=Camellia lanceoleosa TaxID=1840588 RepID=A0ACC0IK13_9ERIC|nr:Developmental protein SEPALLATA 3 [Camellia lanceoleosa]